MPASGDIWVFPEINVKAEEISKLSLGLLSEARSLAEKTGGKAAAVFCLEKDEDYAGVLNRYGIGHAHVFRHQLLKNHPSELCAPLIAEIIRRERPRLFLLGNTAVGRELAARLAVLLETGVVSGCVKIELAESENPCFFRSAYGGQAWEKLIFQTDDTLLAAMDPAVLNDTPCKRLADVSTKLTVPDLDSIKLKTEHLAFLPADYKTIDISEAGTIVSAGMGAVSDDLLPMVYELAELIEGCIGTTRPVVDEGKIDRERMIGQTGKTVSPDLYLALGISGASHHLGGIQEAGAIVSINRDPQAPVFQSSDLGIAADLHEVLPKLIEKIRQAKKDGKIL